MVRKQAVKIIIDHNLCKGTDGCGLCMHVCPRDVYDKGEMTDRGIRPPRPARPDQCTACQLCVMYCPDFAIIVDAGERNE